jgi:FAD/FMN-containing dehydrogenase/Fe-S oxidoreductase
MQGIEITMDELSADIVNELKRSITGEVKTDQVSRVLYSTDASIHRMEPLGVVFPRRLDELEAIVEIAKNYQVPLIPRGSGSSLAGQSIGNGLIIDCSRYLNKLVNINQEERTAVVEPGLILDDLNRVAKKYDLVFGPDPASSERATMGGCIGNNATGAHSILYGMTADHIISADVVLADGSVANLKAISWDEAEFFSNDDSATSSSRIEKKIYQTANKIRSEYREEIRKNWPVTWRRTSGYNLNYLLPWSPTSPPQWDMESMPYPPVALNMVNLSQLIAGSEGTLGILRKATIRLVPVRRNKLISVINFSRISDACAIVPQILKYSPSAIELIPQSLIRLARSVPIYANLLSFAEGDPAALLVVEFSGEDSIDLLKKVETLNRLEKWAAEPYIALTAAQQKQVWDVRNVGLGILMSRLGDVKPATFIEDMSVPVEKLGEFVEEMDVILNEHGTQADYYGHASAGCLHIRPLLNIKTSVGRAQIRSIAEAAVKLVLRLGGAISAEHGDGITRGEWVEAAYGPRIRETFRMLKQSADPDGILNPGKIIDSPKMDTMLRFDDTYHPRGWTPVMTFSSEIPESTKLVEAIEQCNGVGVCRKSEGVMCPSFQATKDEMYSTRGRANLLRTMAANGFTTPELALHAVKETLDNCLACKGCKAECPSAVDMAKLKYEFLQYYYTETGHKRPLRDYLFGYIAQLLRFGKRFAPIVNFMVTSEKLVGLREKLLGLSRNRMLPKLSGNTIHDYAKQYIDTEEEPDCLFLSDAFNEYYYHDVGVDALMVLRAAGCKVKILATIGTGRTLISKGFLDQARKHARKLVDEIKQIDPLGKLPIIGLEPSEIYTLKDEYLDLLPKDMYVNLLAERAFMIDEFLLRLAPDGLSHLSKISATNDLGKDSTKILLHGHCYQKARPPAKDGLPTGVNATVSMLENMGYLVSTINDGCCGMAGAFGYEAEHYDLSMQVGELSLFPAIKRFNKSIVAACGISCKSQIEDGTGRTAVHPISLVARRCVR